jgi:ABC-2 type transport system ATP-binding protein
MATRLAGTNLSVEAERPRQPVSGANDMPNAIAMVGLTKHYKGVQALTDLTLDVPAGTVFGFLGPNGAGKTTALKVLAGLAHPTAGSATINGVAVSAAGEHRRELGYLAQDPRFYGWMTGRETLRYVARFRGADRNRETWISNLLDRVGITDAADRRTSTYSGGMRQRLGIAQALVGRPAVILLDEPVSALDPQGRKDLLDLMRELKGETTVFYSTHILDDVQRVSDHVAILDHGRLVKAAPTQSLLGSFTKNMLRVVLGGAGGGTNAAILGINGVASAVAVSSAEGATTYDVTTVEGASADVQRSITRFAVDAGLTLISNTEETLDLETVFLRLIDQKEVAA